MATAPTCPYPPHRRREAAGRSGDKELRMRVLLADDHRLFRDGLSRLLEVRGLEVVGQAQHGREAVELARRLRPDVILMDLDMPEMTGPAATRLIRAELPEVNVVILTSSQDDANLVEALASGARGYLLKGLPSMQLLDALERVQRGELVLPGALSLPEVRARNPPARVGPHRARRTSPGPVLRISVDTTRSVYCCSSHHGR
jgi:DNA-binding NarL/FixJ family response regulator